MISQKISGANRAIDAVCCGVDASDDSTRPGARDSFQASVAIVRFRRDRPKVGTLFSVIFGVYDASEEV
jgi:hypothetical protein